MFCVISEMIGLVQFPVRTGLMQLPVKPLAVMQLAVMQLAVTQLAVMQLLATGLLQWFASSVLEHVVFHGLYYEEVDCQDCHHCPPLNL